MRQNEQCIWNRGIGQRSRVQRRFCDSEDVITTPEKNVAGRGRGRREWTEWTAARAGDRGRRMSLFVRGRGAKRSYSRFASPQRLWVDQEFEIGINRELA